MSDPTVPPTPPPGDPPTGSPPPPFGAGAPPPPAGESGNRQLMLILSYLWVLALIPYLTEQRDPEVKWHARHGLVLLVAEIILSVVLFILTLLPVIGCVFSVVWMVAWLGIVVLHVICIVKAVGGERFTVPYVSQYVSQIP
ncbi:MAG TPA: DUF4870 domain-containing protein [Thermoanaerobaculia bacterium]|nr:DUF4870 domain-containing protein [Thermoanaerobaculia bacterium]